MRPWLEEGRGALQRSLVVAPTRGQTHALKQRCLEDRVPVLGVEFLTPGLARRKRGVPAAVADGLQSLLLRSWIQERIEALPLGDARRGPWRSLESDLDAAIADLEDLQRSGFGPEHFPRGELREVFGALHQWLASHGYVVPAALDLREGLGSADVPGQPIADRILVLAGGPENWTDFFGLVALARRCTSITVALAEPEFQGGSAVGEEWVDAWEKILGVPPLPVDVPEPAESCEPVAELWGKGGSAERADVIIGRTRSDEMELVADRISVLLEAGAPSIGVVFPRADPSHARLVRILERNGTAFADLVGCVGMAPIETRIQAAFADLHARGCRLDELLSLWPLLVTHGTTRLDPARARRVCEALYEHVQSNGFAPHLGLLEELAGDDGREVARVASLLLPRWPERLTAQQGLDLFSAASARLGLEDPPGWGALRQFASRSTEEFPARALLEAIRSFIPDKAPAAAPATHSAFARVTLTTPRRASGVVWSHVIFTEANALNWPRQQESSCWLGDEERSELNRNGGRFSFGLPTSARRTAFERRLYQAIARDTRFQVTFSAAYFDEEDQELTLEPNAWLERVLWAKGRLGAGRRGALAGLARAGIAKPTDVVDPEWIQIWLRRRDPRQPFDTFFFGDPELEPLRSMSPSQMEKGIEDPVSLWFGRVLKLHRTEWRPFARSQERTLGNAVHEVLALALRSEPTGASFAVLPGRAVALEGLKAALRDLRARWPRTLDWTAFHNEVSWAAGDLLSQVFELGGGAFGASEARLPSDASVPVGEAMRIGVTGRPDLVLADRERWNGARVDICDFKTGSQKGLSASKMAKKADLIQLGIYLESARSLGAVGRVWVLRPGAVPTSLSMDALPGCLVQLGRIARHLETGLYGALTEERKEHAHPFDWPLACAPIAEATLQAKYDATFGPFEGGPDDE